MPPSDGSMRDGAVTMSPPLIAALVDRTSAAILAAADELTALDQAIGDGDHGINMARGFKAIAAQRDELAAMTLGDALAKAGMTLVTTVGGASGPLYGSLLMGMGKAAKAGADPTAQLAEGVEMVKRRGKSDVGAKTMLDVLVPVLGALPASAGVEATKPMLATRGRASFLGERSRGHYDPGASSARLLVHAVCDAIVEAG
jgi:dihydroxyacetone kinase-like protein